MEDGVCCSERGLLPVGGGYNDPTQLVTNIIRAEIPHRSMIHRNARHSVEYIAEVPPSQNTHLMHSHKMWSVMVGDSYGSEKPANQDNGKRTSHVDNRVCFEPIRRDCPRPTGDKRPRRQKNEESKRDEDGVHNDEFLMIAPRNTVIIEDPSATATFNHNIRIWFLGSGRDY